MFDFIKRLFGAPAKTPPAPLPSTTPETATATTATVPVRPRDPDATVPLPELTARAGVAEAPKYAFGPHNRRFTLAAAQDVGRVRNHNEDVLMIFHGELSGLETMPPMAALVVADGMGGHSLGERASGIAARAAMQYILRQILPSLLADSSDPVERPMLTEVVENAVVAANMAVTQTIPEGGTTLTCALVVGEQAVFAHVGDSRAYLIAPDRFEPLTRDHSLVQRLKELGQITEDEALVHPQRSVLYRAIGQGEGLEVDIVTRRLPPGSMLLLCSDGLWGLVSDALMQQIIRQSKSLQEACEALVKAANDAGGPDNITAVMLHMPA